MIRDAIILGAGAAGLMCAMTAGRRGFSCAVIDHSPVAGRKVRLAGGGKGNVTNRYISPEWYVGTQKGFPDTLLKRCSTDFVLSMLASFGIEWEEREYGQIFCTVQAARLVESMAAACRNAGAELLFNRTFGEIRHEGGLFSVETSGGTLQAPRLVIATGSPAWPTCGATDGGMRLARQWGHKVVPVRPVLAPLLLPESWPLHGLAGVSLPAAVSVGGRTFRYPLLFTHKGLSGPPSFKHPASGDRAKRCISTFCPTIPPWSLCTNPSTARVRFGGCSKRCSPPAWPNGSYRDRWLQEKSLSLPKKTGNTLR